MRPEVLGILPNIPSSIRAPTWDTTGSDRHLHPSSLRFNPRTRGGRDVLGSVKRWVLLMFQSTRPRRARREGSPEGLPRDQVSIHAPAEGATRRPLTPPANPVVSIHAPAEGATTASRQERPSECCFNPRARGGRDAVRGPCVLIEVVHPEQPASPLDSQCLSPGTPLQRLQDLRS